MHTFEIVGGIIMIALSIAIIFLVLMQEGTKGGMSAMTGGDSFYNKNQGRTTDAMLFRATKFAAIGFFVLTLLVYMVSSRMA